MSVKEQIMDAMLSGIVELLHDTLDDHMSAEERGVIRIEVPGEICELAPEEVQDYIDDLHDTINDLQEQLSEQNADTP